MARRPSQSPRDEKSIEFHSLRKGLIARTPRVTCCAGAAGVGRVLGMVAVYRGGQKGLKSLPTRVFATLEARIPLPKSPPTLVMPQVLLVGPLSSRMIAEWDQGLSD